MAYLQWTSVGRRLSSPRSTKEPNQGVAVALIFVMWIFVNIVVLWKTASLNAADVYTRTFWRGEARFWLHTTLVHLSMRKFCTLKPRDAPIDIAALRALIVHVPCTYCACGGRGRVLHYPVSTEDGAVWPNFSDVSTPFTLHKNTSVKLTLSNVLRPKKPLK